MDLCQFGREIESAPWLPLCKTEVHAPRRSSGNLEHALSTVRGEGDRPPTLDKNRKGLIELVIAFMGIADITCSARFRIAHFSP